MAHVGRKERFFPAATPCRRHRVWNPDRAGDGEAKPSWCQNPVVHGAQMKTKTRLSEAADAARSIAGAALGAAAIAATGVVITRVAAAIRESGKTLEDAKPTLQSMAAKTLASPLLPGRKRRAASRRKTRAPKMANGAKRAAAKRRRTARSHA